MKKHIDSANKIIAILDKISDKLDALYAKHQKDQEAMESQTKKAA